MTNKTRAIVVPIIKDELDNILICKMPEDRGVYPGKWALPGGGIEPGETMGEALRREVKEELGIQIKNIQPWTFSDTTREKIMKNGEKTVFYMIFLMFDCEAVSTEINLNDEFDEYAWVKPAELHKYDLNPASIESFKQKGFLG